MKVGDIMEKENANFMVLDDTVDIGKTSTNIKNNTEQKFRDELIKKYKNKYHIDWIIDLLAFFNLKHFAEMQGAFLMQQRGINYDWYKG